MQDTGRVRVEEADHGYAEVPRTYVEREADLERRKASVRAARAAGLASRVAHHPRVSEEESEDTSPKPWERATTNADAEEKRRREENAPLKPKLKIGRRRPVGSGWF